MNQVYLNIADFIVTISILIVLGTTFFAYVLLVCMKRKKIHQYFKSNVVDKLKDPSQAKKNRYVDVTKNKLQQFHTEDIESLKKYFYEIFFQFEMAYNNLDYQQMRFISTEQLFQNYYIGITLDLKAGKKRIITQMKKKNVVLYELDSTTVKQTASLMIEVSYLNYTVNRNGEVIRGNREVPITEKFEVTFRKDFKKDKLERCPNCGASMMDGKCEYCNTIWKNEEFKISNIKRIIE